MAKLTLEEKRRQSIYRQLYGKQTVSLPKTEHTTTQTTINKVTYQPSVNLTLNNLQAGDSKYLKVDLLKVVALSSAAIVIQFILYFAQKNHLIKLSF